MRKLSNGLARTAGALGLTVAALTGLSAAPASAGTAAAAGCTKYYSNENIQVQVDNCSSGWVWLYAADPGTYFKATVIVTDSFGHVQPELAVDRGKSTAKKFEQVHSFHLCGTKYLSWAPPTWKTYCTNEIYV
ncbi:hypothetical protein ABT263_23380 [Kitasatospora sp. NPDC001603]|uniref:hypothetical protein n=1 Tax=Kitasatospora sp. NPDC001603 TaxID=3154388 RepID=UPI003328621F